MNHLSRLLVHIKQLSKNFWISLLPINVLLKFMFPGAQFQAFKNRAQGISSGVGAAQPQANVKPKVPPQQGVLILPLRNTSIKIKNVYS